MNSLLMEECQICSTSSQGNHFGVPTCKACAAFFRRSMAESMTYRCRYSNDCDVSHSGRNHCRACRLQKCHRVGMKGIDIARAPVGKTLQVRTSLGEYVPPKSGNITPPISTSLSLNVNSSSMLNKMSQFHQNFLASQKSLFKIINLTSANILQLEIPFKQVTIENYNKMEQANASLIASTLHDYFPFFSCIDKDKKKHFFGAFASVFNHFHKCWMTAEYLSTNDLVALQYGHYISCSLQNVRQFFGDVDRLPEIRRFLSPFGETVKKIAQKMKEMKMTDLEVGGVVGFIFYTQLSQTDLWNDERLAEHNQLTIDLHNHLLNVHGFAQGGLRFVRIMSLLLDMEKIELNATNMHILSNFLLDDDKKFAILQDNFFK